MFHAPSGATAGQPEGQRQVVLEPQERVQGNDATAEKREQRDRVHAPALLAVGVDADEPVDESLRSGVARRGEDLRHVVPERPVDGDERADQQRHLEPGGERGGHQNRSGFNSAQSR